MSKLVANATPRIFWDGSVKGVEVRAVLVDAPPRSLPSEQRDSGLRPDADSRVVLQVLRSIDNIGEPQWMEIDEAAFRGDTDTSLFLRCMLQRALDNPDNLDCRRCCDTGRMLTRCSDAERGLLPCPECERGQQIAARTSAV